MWGCKEKGCAEKSKKGIEREGVLGTLWGVWRMTFMCTFCTCDVIPMKIRGGEIRKGENDK